MLSSPKWVKSSRKCVPAAVTSAGRISWVNKYRHEPISLAFPMPMNTEALSKLLGSLYDAAADPNLWEPYLQQLALNTNARSAALVLHDADQDLHSVHSSWGLDPDGIRLYREYYGSIDVWTQRAMPISSNWVCHSEDLCPRSELVTTEIYNDFLAEFGIEHCLSSDWSIIPGLIWLLSVSIATRLLRRSTLRNCNWFALSRRTSNALSNLTPNFAN